MTVAIQSVIDYVADQECVEVALRVFPDDGNWSAVIEIGTQGRVLTSDRGEPFTASGTTLQYALDELEALCGNEL